MIEELTYFDVNGDAYKVLVSFELSYFDWCEIQKSNQWKQFSQLLQEARKQI